MAQLSHDDVEEKRAEADALEDLAERVSSAESIAEDAPVLSELFHAVRTSQYRSRDGRHVGLFDLDLDSGEWSCRSVAFLEQGTHYRDTGADLSVSFKPYPFLSVEHFAEHVSSSIRRDARAARQVAGDMERKIRDRQNRKEYQQ